MKKILLLLLLLLSTGLWAQQTAIPDINFEQALIDLGYDSGAPDGFVSTLKISKVTSLFVRDKNITSLAGIQDFSVLEELFCENNELTALNVSQNLALTQLSCASNEIRALDTSKNVKLEILICFDNRLSVLDINKNTRLRNLSCSNNELRAIDVSKNKALRAFSCSSNLIRTLDVSKNSALTNLNCFDNQLTFLNVKNGNNNNFTGFLANNNPNLYCINVDDAGYSNVNWTSIDSQTKFADNCSTLSIKSIKQ